MTITEFLLARITEDEVYARERTNVHRMNDAMDYALGERRPNWHLSRGERIRAECEAKRRIMAEHPDYGGYGESCARCADSDIDLTPWPCPTLRHLTAVYGDHPDYEETWRP